MFQDYKLCGTYTKMHQEAGNNIRESMLKGVFDFSMNSERDLLQEDQYTCFTPLETVISIQKLLDIR